MTIVQIKHFLAILEYNSFSNAAEEMFISQSALSKQIKSLENELGTALFVRSNNNLNLFLQLLQLYYFVLLFL